MSHVQFSKSEFILLLTVCLGLFAIPMTITSSSILNLSIMTKFGLSYYQSQWFITLFMIFYASFMAITGSVSDIFGRKYIYFLGIFLMLLGFLIGAFAGQYILLIITRAICGVGAAAVTTGGTALLASNMSVEKKEKAFSIFGCALGISMVGGPLLAAYVSKLKNGWEVFALSMSVLLLFTLFLTVLVKDNSERRKVKVDWQGGIILTASLLCAVLVLSFMPLWGFVNLKSVLFILLSTAGFMWLALIERKSLNPIVSPHILKVKKFRAMCITTLLLGFGYVSLLFYLPYYLKMNALLSGTNIGWAATLATLPSLVFPLFISKFKHHFQNTQLLFATFICLILAPVILCFAVRSHNLLAYVVPLLLFGSSFGISLSFIDGEAVNSVCPTQSGIAAGTFNTFRIGGESISIPLLGFVVSLFSQHETHLFHPAEVNFHGMVLTLITIAVVCAFFSFYVIKKMWYLKREQDHAAPCS